MRKLHVGICLIAWVAFAAAARATPAINVGSFTLLANTPDQTIPIIVTGGDAVAGFNLRAQINDGTGPQAEPIFQNVDVPLISIWAGHNYAANVGPTLNEPLIQAAIALQNPGDTVPALGQVLTLHISTVGISGGSYPLMLAATQFGKDSDFVAAGGTEMPTTITNGTINVIGVPEPGTATIFVIAAMGILRRRREQEVLCRRLRN